MKYAEIKWNGMKRRLSKTVRGKDVNGEGEN
jgi:hypothetical protein